jgi:hypothetical protein
MMNHKSEFTNQWTYLLIQRNFERENDQSQNTDYQLMDLHTDPHQSWKRK